MQIIADIKVAGMDITEEINIKYFLGVNIDKIYSETYHMSQTQLTNQIVSNLGLSKSDATPRDTPSLTTNILGKVQDAKKSDQHFHYCRVIGKLKYFEKST